MKFTILFNDVDSQLVNNYCHAIAHVESDEYDKIVEGQILQPLESKSICFKLEGINRLQQLAMKMMDGVHLADTQRTDLEFCDLQTDNQDIIDMYNLLTENTKGLCKLLYEENPSVELEYVQPLSTLCDVYLDMNIRNFLKFIQTCFDYTELNTVVECIVESGSVDELIQLSNIEDSFQLYLKTLIDPVPRGDVTDKELNEVPIVFETPLDKLHSLVKDVPAAASKILTLNSVMTCSYTCYEELLDLGYNKNIKMENPYHVMNSPECYDINLTLPLSILDSKHLDLVYEISNGWVQLINFINNLEVDIHRDALLAQLGAMMVVFKHSISIADDFRFMTEVSHSDELKAIRDNRLKVLCDSSLADVYDWVIQYQKSIDIINKSM